MDVQLNVIDLLKLAVKFIRHKCQQYWLATNDFANVMTTYGPIKGRQRKLLYNTAERYYAFEGIPYAKPPLGKLRFQAPEIPEAWSEILDCTQYRSKPLQKHLGLPIIEGSEDCLYLNVYTKSLKSLQALPVMVFIYGGGFQIGEASRDIYAPDYFMTKDMVLVTFNYRLGALGFLSLNDSNLGVAGNGGLKDQILALRWVRQNIHNFNGDPNNITVFGESAGAASIHILMLTEQAKGLFHKAILQSGSVLCPWVQAPSNDWPYRLACQLGYTGNNDEHDILDFLMHIDGKLLASSHTSIQNEEELKDYVIFPFGPVVEPYLTNDCVISRPFIELFPNAWGNSIPIIIGGNSYEGLFVYPLVAREPSKFTEIEAVEDCFYMLPPDLRCTHSHEDIESMALTLRTTYFKDYQKLNQEQKIFSYVDLMSYYLFWHGIHRTIRARCKYAATLPTFCYRFDFDSEFFNHFRIINCGPSIRGVDHADDISYLFYNVTATKLSKTQPEYQTIERLIGMWYNFAKYGDPNCEEIDKVKWLPIDPAALQNNQPYKCFNISHNLELIDIPEYNKLLIWDSFYKNQTLF